MIGTLINAAGVREIELAEKEREIGDAKAELEAKLNG